MAETVVPSVIWMRPTRGSRGPQPSRDREAITRTAITIADREGVAAVSMRRIAAEIGTGTSSLYRYFARKDDLLNLMVDGALAGGDSRSSGDWRADMRQVAEGLRARFKDHPWLCSALAGKPTLGPNRMRTLEQSLSLLEATKLSLTERLTIIDTVASYVRGYVASEVADIAARAQSGLAEEQWDSDQAEYAESLKRSGSYPLSAALFIELEKTESEHRQSEGFSAGLDIILDGIQVRLNLRRL
ncbi:MAG: TetR/AcrR family transcriptional regulator [Pseudomonadota bacterium]|uniref:TetR/AcrR family transcriptional regulator n=1 Tax=Sphingomonas sp. ERG5 TaxID=1381597 RepID=UPI001269EF81|nr:TetR/AcrR family transcriptional regulator [Sphingomonas sp. ERG5]